MWARLTRLVISSYCLLGGGGSSFASCFQTNLAEDHSALNIARRRIELSRRVLAILSAPLLLISLIPAWGVIGSSSDEAVSRKSPEEADASSKPRAPEVTEARGSVLDWDDPSQGGTGDYVSIDSPDDGSKVSGLTSLSGRAGNSPTHPDEDGGGGDDPGFAEQSQVVIAMIDTGGNPYHGEFRAEDRLVHPSRYLRQFPASVPAVPLCFTREDSSGAQWSHIGAAGNCPASASEAWNHDSSAWSRAGVTPLNQTGAGQGNLVWFPGTRLMGISFAHTDPSSPVTVDQGGTSQRSHGSWVSGTAIGKTKGDCPECLLVIIEGDTVDAINAGYQWAANQPWIDVITSSVSIGLIGVGTNPGIFPYKHDGAVRASVNGKLFFTAAGNGAANAGLAPTSSLAYDTSSPATIQVGASSNDEFIQHWSDFPAHIAGTGSSRSTSDPASFSSTRGVTGTSFSSPSAAGVLSNSLLQARRAVGDTDEGATADSGTGALNLLRNTTGVAISSGPFANGVLTRDELEEVFFKNAYPRYNQLTTVPGPVQWAKNAYGIVNAGANGINDGGTSIQGVVTKSILGERGVPVRALEQYWVDRVVRPIQEEEWGARPVVDGDGDAWPRDDSACVPDCLPDELERYITNFLGLSSQQSSVKGLIAVLEGLEEPVHQAGGLVGEVGPAEFSDDGPLLEVRLPLKGLFDGSIPSASSTPISYEVQFMAGHNGVVQPYRLKYEFRAIDWRAPDTNQLLVDKFELFVLSAPDAQGLASICPVEADLSMSEWTEEAATFRVPLSTFDHSNRPTRAQGCAGFQRDGRGLQAGDTLTNIRTGAVVTAVVVNFGAPEGYKPSEDYTITGSGGEDPADSVTLTVNGVSAGAASVENGTWSHDIDFDNFPATQGEYVVEARFGTAKATAVYLTVNNEPPAAVIVAPDRARTGEAVTFDGSGSFDPNGRIDSWVCDMGDGTVLNGEIVQHTYARPGPKTVRLTVTDNHGARDTATHRINIQGPPT